MNTVLDRRSELATTATGRLTVIALACDAICIGALALLTFLTAIADEPTLRLGAVLSLTGAAAVHGTGIQEGLEFAKQELGKKGKNVEIVYQDDGTEPKRTINALESGIASGLRFFIGPTWDFSRSPPHRYSYVHDPCPSSHVIPANL